MRLDAESGVRTRLDGGPPEAPWIESLRQTHGMAARDSGWGDSEPNGARNPWIWLFGLNRMRGGFKLKNVRLDKVHNYKEAA